MSDNISVVARLNKREDDFPCPEPSSSSDARMIRIEGLTLTATYIPGKRNVVADTLSRSDQIVGTEWSLEQSLVNRLFKLWVGPTLDVFATSMNHKLPLYRSPVPDK